VAKPSLSRHQPAPTAKPASQDAPPHVVSNLPEDIPVTAAELGLIMASLGPRLAEIFADGPDV